MKIQRSTGVNGKRRCICRNLGWYRRDSAPLGRLGVPPFFSVFDGNCTFQPRHIPVNILVLHAPAGCLVVLIIRNYALVTKSQLFERSEFCDFVTVFSRILYD